MLPMIPVAAWWIGGGVLGALGLLRVNAVMKKNAAKKAVPSPSPAQVAAVTPAQVQQAAAAAGLTPAQLAQAAAAAGTTPAVIAAATQSGASVADALLAAAQSGGLSAQINPLSVPEPLLAAKKPAQTARITTNDPAPMGDLIIRSGPAVSFPQIGGAEKDGVVFVDDMNASAEFAKIRWPGGSRLPASEGFVKKKFLSTSFNGDGSPDVSSEYGKDYA